MNNVLKSLLLIVDAIGNNLGAKEQDADYMQKVIDAMLDSAGNIEPRPNFGQLFLVVLAIVHSMGTQALESLEAWNIDQDSPSKYNN